MEALIKSFWDHEEEVKNRFREKLRKTDFNYIDADDFIQRIQQCSCYVIPKSERIDCIPCEEKLYTLDSIIAVIKGMENPDVASNNRTTMIKVSYLPTNEKYAFDVMKE